MLKGKQHILFYLMGIGILVSVLFYTAFELNWISKGRKLTAEQGILNLSQISPTKNMLVPLIGEWEFYWKQFVPPSVLASDSILAHDYFVMPGIWNPYNALQKNPGHGWATFRLKIKLAEKGRYGIKVKELNCAYRLYVNGTCAIENGRLGENAKDELPSWKRQEYFFDNNTEDVDIVLHMSNFHHRKGGPGEMILFGRAEEVYKYKLKHTAITYFILGIVLVMVFYHLVMYMFRTNDKSNLVFALSSFLLSIRLSVTGEEVLSDMLPNIPWGLSIRLEYLSFILPVPLLYAFFYILFEKEFPKRYLVLSTILAVLFSLIVLLTPSTFFSYTPVFYQIIIGGTSLYILLKLIVATLRRKENAQILLGGYLLLFLVVVNDILFYNNVLHTSYLTHIGMLVVIFAQGFALSNRSAKAFLYNEALSSELEVLNWSLEGKVQERTQQVKAKNKELEKKSEALLKSNNNLRKLSEFKQSMTSMLVHDLKNPLNTIINLSEKGDATRFRHSIKEAGTVMLNLIMNMLDIYKNEDGQMVIEPKEVLLSNVIRRGLHETEYAAAKKNMRVVVSAASDYQLNGDLNLLVRVVVNLLDNAIKHSSENEKIKISVIDRHEVLEVHILDAGVGVAPNETEFIFEKYKITNLETSKSKFSTGLGLAFCKMAIEAHYGAIHVDSDGVNGADFWFSLPYRKKLGGNPIEVLPSEDIDLALVDCEQVMDELNTLRELNIYQITEITHILDLIEKRSGKSMYAWLIKMRNVVENCNESEYNTLLNNLC